MVSPSKPKLESIATPDATCGPRIRKVRRCYAWTLTDAVMYMRETLDAFGKMSPEELRLAAYELAMAGQCGLNLKDAETTYQLRCLSGESTAMRIVSSMYAAFQLIMPGTDVGIDLSREYQLAKTGG